MSWAGSVAARNTMRANHRRDTRPELAVRQRLHARGWRYRVDFRLAPPLRVRADVVFTRALIAVFIDGCFWHSCPVHRTEPKTNAEYWGPKLARNVERDRETDRALAELGWRVLRFWEHEDADAVVVRIEAELRAAR